MPFGSVKDIVSAYDEGRWHHQIVYRNTSIYQPGTNSFCDWSMSGGTPKYNAYIGGQLESTAMIGSGNNGIYAGPTPASGMTKHVAKIMASSASSAVPIQHLVLCDYLMFYPLVDGDSTDLQETVAVDSLPRYADGLGVKMVFVMTGGAAYAGSNVTVSYTNSDGVSGRTSNASVQSGLSLTNLAACQTSLWGTNVTSYYLPLQSGDLGVRSVESVQFATGTGVFFALLLFKPLIEIQCMEQNTAAEIDYVNQRSSMPRVYDGAYLNFLVSGSAGASTGSSALHAGIDFIWN